jgi:hypothetical protein
MRETDRLFLILHRAGWSIGDTAFAGKDGISWLGLWHKGRSFDSGKRKESGGGLETGLPPG